MDLSVIKDVVTSKASRQILLAKKHSPVILLGAGIVGVGATVVLACRATLKVEEVITHHQETLKDINTTEHVNYTDDDRVKDKTVLYVHTTVSLLKLYSPAVMIGLASVSFLVGGHQIQAKRNAGLMAAYSALEKAFEKYRQRVVDDMGMDKDRDYRYGVDERVIVEETDEGQRITKVKSVDENGTSGYAKLFSEDSSTSWSKTPDYNIMFLRAQQNYLNDRLRAKGHVSLNDAYDALGLERTPAGQIVGWVWEGNGDNYVDFGIFDSELKPQHFEFFTGKNNAVLIDFNVDGVMYDKI